MGLLLWEENEALRKLRKIMYIKHLAPWVT